jgi:hypothetical protein
MLTVLYCGCAVRKYWCEVLFARVADFFLCIRWIGSCNGMLMDDVWYIFYVATCVSRY